MVKVSLEHTHSFDIPVNNQCVVCLGDMTSDDQAQSLLEQIQPCKHVLHKACIDPWLSQNHLTCPTCRTNIDNLKVPEGFHLLKESDTQYLAANEGTPLLRRTSLPQLVSGTQQSETREPYRLLRVPERSFGVYTSRAVFLAL